MSVALLAVRRCRLPSAVVKCTLLVLATHADEDGLSYPGVRVLAEEVCTSRTNIVNALRELERRRLIELVELGRQHGTSTYRLTPSGTAVVPLGVDPAVSQRSRSGTESGVHH